MEDINELMKGLGLEVTEESMAITKDGLADIEINCARIY
jgi:hypothetical protein